MRRNARDTNAKDIKNTFIGMRCSVVDLSDYGHGVPDLLVGVGGHCALVEIKTEGGELRDNQKEFFEEWRGPAYIVRNHIDSITVVNKIRNGNIE